MPLFDQYSTQLKSHLADINNIGTSSRFVVPGAVCDKLCWVLEFHLYCRSAGACTAAAFLRKFVSAQHWAHLDIAGVMESKGEVSYLRKGMSGE